MSQRPPIPTPRAHLLNAYSNKEANEYEIINANYNIQEPNLQNIENVKIEQDMNFTRNETQMESELGSRLYYEVDSSSNIGALSGSIKKIDDPSEVEGVKPKTKTCKKSHLSHFLSCWKNNRHKKSKNQIFLENFEIKNITFDGPFEGEKSTKNIYDAPPTYEEAIKNSAPHSLKEYRMRWHKNSNYATNKNCGRIFLNDDNEPNSLKSHELYKNDRDISFLATEKMPNDADAIQIFSTRTSHLEWISKMCSYFDDDLKDFNEDNQGKKNNREFFC